MNHISTHDTMRAITALAGESCEYRDRYWQSTHSLDGNAYKNGVQLVKMASAVQFTLPGVPSIYYGDEAGMQGYKDPFNRCCYPWGNENKELLEWYRKLGEIRSANKCFVDGRLEVLSSVAGCVAYSRKKDENAILVISNSNPHSITYYVKDEWSDAKQLCPWYACGCRSEINSNIEKKVIKCLKIINSIRQNRKKERAFFA